MQFSYIAATDEVTGLNRAGQAGEETGTCTGEQRTKGMTPAYYTAPGGVLTAKSQVEIDAIIRDQAEADALSRLVSCYNQQINAGGFEYVGRDTKLTKSLRKEGKGTAAAVDIKRLDDNDVVDNWYDALELDMESGEAWVEEPIRTTEELTAFDPCVDVHWTEAPIL